ncbi:MAG TPA: single-stranded DNA-binding protein [Chloroflexota bacterium]|nr:single-stranded DNA-binding protein [Chloroflexota bacterium]
MLKAQIVGNVGSDPELRYSTSGSPFLRFDIASNGRTRTASGEWKDETTWVRVTVFGQRAETLSQHVQRGTRVYCDGRLEPRPWIDRSNEPRAGLELLADTIEFAGRRQAAEDADEPSRVSVADERRDRRRMPEATAIHGGQPRGGTAAVADRDGEDLENLPF